MADAGYVSCPRCERRVSMTKVGVLRAHKYQGERCGASGLTMGQAAKAPKYQDSFGEGDAVMIRRAQGTLALIERARQYSVDVVTCHGERHTVPRSDVLGIAYDASPSAPEALVAMGGWGTIAANDLDVQKIAERLSEESVGALDEQTGALYLTPYGDEYRELVGRYSARSGSVHITSDADRDDHSVVSRWRATLTVIEALNGHSFTRWEHPLIEVRALMSGRSWDEALDAIRTWERTHVSDTLPHTRHIERSMSAHKRIALHELQMIEARKAGLYDLFDEPPPFPALPEPSQSDLDDESALPSLADVDLSMIDVHNTSHRKASTAMKDLNKLSAPERDLYLAFMRALEDRSVSAHLTFEKVREAALAYLGGARPLSSLPSQSTDRRRLAYHYSATLRTMPGRWVVGRYTAGDDIAVTLIEPEDTQELTLEEGFTVERVVDGYAAFSRSDSFDYHGVGSSPESAIADADLNLVNNNAVVDGRKAPYIGYEQAWLLCGVSAEEGALDWAVIPRSVAYSSDDARDLAELPGALAHLERAHLVEVVDGHTLAFGSAWEAAEYLKDHLCAEGEGH